MTEGIVIFMYVIFYISFICSIVVTIKLYASGQNYLIAVLAAGMALCQLIVLSSIFWIDDFKKNVPKVFCTSQGIALQYSIYVQITAALCFSFHLYQLLVRYKQNMTPFLEKVYVCCIIGIPIIMTIVVAVVSILNDAVRPFALNCDIKTVWVRLIGYSGFNFVLTFIGVYLSARAAYEVFRHLDRFKTQFSEQPERLNTSRDEEEIKEKTPRPSTTSQPNPGLQKQVISYNMTKFAAIRMVLFSCGFAIINLIASIQTIILSLSGVKEFESKGLYGIGGNDIAGAFMGIIIFLIFGLPQGFKKFSCCNIT